MSGIDGGFKREFTKEFPALHALLREAGFAIHPSVTRIVLHGSRGPKGGSRPDSDIDVSLIIDASQVESRGDLLRDSLHYTLSRWRGSIELDLAAIFDKKGCGLPCFNRRSHTPLLCPDEAPDCFGVYKIQRGFDGYVENLGISVEAMYPCSRIWEKR